VLDIIIRDAFGWDLENGVAIGDNNIFQKKVLALAGAIEEQGRATLHAHFQLWLENYSKQREDLWSSDQPIRRAAKRNIAALADIVCDNELFDKRRCPFQKKSYGVFPHDNCTEEDDRLREAPTIVEDQRLRRLRHQVGQHKDGRIFAVCPRCTKSWTNERLVESFLKNSQPTIQGLTKFPDQDTNRLKAMCMEYQKPGNALPVDKTVVSAAVNHHRHVKSCFPNTKTKRKRQAENILGNQPEQKKVRHSRSCAECRHRYPKLPCDRTHVQAIDETPIVWYKWDGTYEKRLMYDIVTKRHAYDAFQNTCCPAITFSKITSNSNIRALFPGRIAQYTFKYNMKDTQKSDTEPYANVKTAMQRTLGRAERQSEQENRTDRQEAIRRVLAASFAHQKESVLHGTMASFLTRRKRRFIFSHETVWTPLSELHKAMTTKTDLFSSISFFGNKAMFQNSALNYLCRSKQLEHLNPYGFYSRYDTVNITRNNRDNVLAFIQTTEFTHPSFQQKKQACRQGSEERERTEL